jgi:formylglycine-generating enzyme required for sulfatase activity
MKTKKLLFAALFWFVTAANMALFAQTSQNFLHISGGTFTMGSPYVEFNRFENETQHKVTLSGFSIARYPVTVGEFRQFVNQTGYRTTAETSGGGKTLVNNIWQQRQDINWKNPSFQQSDDCPVVEVSWFDAINYCNWLSAKEGLVPAYRIQDRVVSWNRNANGYRLPTEAEWECVCRAGTTTPFFTGMNITTDQANYDGSKPYMNNPPGILRNRTLPVGSFAPNPWGVYDMHGNVGEWCWDWFDNNYTRNDAVDPQGPPNGRERSYRGGGFLYDAQYIRSAVRDHDPPDYCNTILGFRLARSETSAQAENGNQGVDKLIDEIDGMSDEDFFRFLW